jgi:hypothetical protein
VFSACRILLLSPSHSEAMASQCIFSTWSNVSLRVSSITESSAFSRSLRRKPAMSVSRRGSSGANEELAWAWALKENQTLKYAL